MISFQNHKLKFYNKTSYRKLNASLLSLLQVFNKQDNKMQLNIQK